MHLPIFEICDSHPMGCRPMVCQSSNSAKKAVKSVVEEEDRSRNLISFGLLEIKNENVEERVQ